MNNLTKTIVVALVTTSISTIASHYIIKYLDSKKETPTSTLKKVA